MISFEVQDMTCGHCASTITRAVQQVDREARIQVDLQRHRVDIQPGQADARQLGDAIRDAGYTPVPA